MTDVVTSRDAGTTATGRRAGALFRTEVPTRELLRGAGDAVEIAGSRVEYLAFDATGRAESPPLVIFGGAFQTYWSFQREVARLRERGPLIVLNLPGQGSNFSPSGGMDFSAFADLTRRFLDHHGIGRIVPVGLSYGSAIAHRFATRFPERTERLILGGVAPRLQPSLRSLLESARWFLEEGRRSEWAWSCVFHLINMEARGQTGVSDELVAAFHRSLMRLPEEASERWWTNSVRLFTEALTEAPTCPTLVFGCRHDHFMPPFQAAEVARACPDVEFAVLGHADHLAPLERPDDVIDLYEAYLDGRPLESLPWLSSGAAAYAAVEDRRVTRRGPVDGVRVTVHEVSGEVHGAGVRDLGYHGARVEWDRAAPAGAGPAPLRVRLEDVDAETDAIVCPDSDGSRLRFLFSDPERRTGWIAAVDRFLGGAGG